MCVFARAVVRRCRVGFGIAVATSFICLVALRLGGCGRSSKESVSLTYLDPEWSHDARERRAISEEVLQQFTQETGIRVTHLPAPENSPAQLALVQDLLRKRAPTPDVYSIDVVWPGILSEYLVDLKPYFAKELASDDPELVANDTVKGKLVAMPYHSNVGVLFYRANLLQEYGYNDPPRTWDQLEKMAARIQEGERAKGKKDFWGFVWPGAAGEGLACNALEWQFSQGGGRIIEPNAKITVNNPNAIRAWERAAHWVGWISPPSVISYEEWDAANAFWTSGRAAFLRAWSSDYFNSHPIHYPFYEGSGQTSVPGGVAGRAGAFGGVHLAISRSSNHQAQAMELVRFLLRKEAELEQVRSHSELPGGQEFYELPTMLKAYAGRGKASERPGSGVVRRPSTVTSEKYGEVSKAYSQAVHSVLTGEAKASEAAATLVKELVGMTGFEAGQP
jgi:trehalose/maltose transport system substrate-binding protein